MALAFTDLQTEVYQQANLDSSDTTTQNNVTRWLNYVQNDLCARYPWPFMQGRTSIATVPDYSTGTISINSGSQTVTGSGTTFTSAMAINSQYFIQFSGSNDWYVIATYVSATNITLALAYQGTTNLTNASYIIRKWYYSLPSTVDRIIDIMNQNTPLKMIQVDARTIDDLRPNPESTNTSYGYVVWGVDSSGNIQIIPYPFPSDARVLEMKITIRPTDGSISVPNKYAHVIAWGATAIAWAFKKNLDLARSWDQKFQGRIGEMKGEFRMSEDYQPIMRSIDSVQRAKWLQFPEQYPVVTSG